MIAAAYVRTMADYNSEMNRSDPAISIDLFSSGDDLAASSRMIATAIHVAAAVGLGGMADLFGGLFGVGGGFVVIRFPVWHESADGAGDRPEMVVPNVMWAFSRYRRHFSVDLRMAATIAGSALIATYPTARLATGLDPHVFSCRAQN